MLNKDAGVVDDSLTARVHPTCRSVRSQAIKESSFGVGFGAVLCVESPIADYERLER
jgi:hypothetical protein